MRVKGNFGCSYEQSQQRTISWEEYKQRMIINPVLCALKCTYVNNCLSSQGSSLSAIGMCDLGCNSDFT